MKFIHFLLVSCCTLAIFTGSTQAQETLRFTITQGEVVNTPARCLPDTCEPLLATLSGNFIATINGDDITIDDSQVNTAPDTGFNLPKEPNSSVGGAVSTVKFEFNGSQLILSGSVDSRAFDGPLEQYRLEANVSDEVMPEAFAQRRYFLARPDFRRCVSPLCGGAFVKKVNNQFTRCADGSLQDECYVAEINWKRLGFNAMNTSEGNLAATPWPLLLRGKIKSKKFPGFGNLGLFVAKDAYRSVGESSQFTTGRFAGLENNGIVCITSPCFSYDEYILNRKRIRSVSGIDLEGVFASKTELDQAQNLLADGDVLIAQGSNVQVDGFAGTGITFEATHFFLPIPSPKNAPIPLP